jgi:hypothetical protein
MKSFRILSIILDIIKLDDVSEAGYTSVIRYKTGKGPIQLGPLDGSSLDHWATCGLVMYNGRNRVKSFLSFFTPDDGNTSGYRNSV